MTGGVCSREIYLATQGLVRKRSIPKCTYRTRAAIDTTFSKIVVALDTVDCLSNVPEVDYVLQGHAYCFGLFWGLGAVHQQGNRFMPTTPGTVQKLSDTRTATEVSEQDIDCYRSPMQCNAMQSNPIQSNPILAGISKSRQFLKPLRRSHRDEFVEEGVE